MTASPAQKVLPIWTGIAVRQNSAPPPSAPPVEQAVTVPNPWPKQRAWILGISGIRIESGKPFLRAHQTGRAAQKTAIQSPAHIHAFFTAENRSDPEFAPANRSASQINSSQTLELWIDSKLVATTNAESPEQHAFAHLFIQWERPSHSEGPPICALLGLEMTRFCTPRPGMKHPREFLQTWRPDDPTCPSFVEFHFRGAT